MKTSTTNIFLITATRIMDLKIGLLKVRKVGGYDRGYAILLSIGLCFYVVLCLVFFCLLLGCFVLSMEWMR